MCIPPHAWGVSDTDECVPSNHGSFYYNQLAALKLLVNDNEGAVNVTRTYFAKQFLSQIAADGEQV